jgi:hypothetical protein
MGRPFHGNETAQGLRRAWIIAASSSVDGALELRRQLDAAVGPLAGLRALLERASDSRPRTRKRCFGLFCSTGTLG